MNNKIISQAALFTLLINASNLNAQLTSVTVADLTLKVAGLSTEEFYYGFAEGDVIIFSFEEVNSKELKEIEIRELPGSSKFMEFKSYGIDKKRIKAHKKGVYHFRFTNSSLGKRICKIHIERIPASEDLISFNTGWQWETRYDTTYVPYIEDSLTGYETCYIQKKKKELIRIDTIVTELFNKTERVHSETAIGKSPYSYINVQLPENKYYPLQLYPYESTEVIAWSYWMGVGQRAIEDYERANKALGAGIKVVGALTGQPALASLAVSGISAFGTPTVGDNVNYEFYTYYNGSKRRFDSGNGITAFARNTTQLQGSFTIQLYNDNFRDGIDVNVKVIAVQIKKNWEDKVYTVEKKEPQFVTLNKMRMVVESKEVRVNAE